MWVWKISLLPKRECFSKDNEGRDAYRVEVGFWKGERLHVVASDAETAIAMAKAQPLILRPSESNEIKYHVDALERLMSVVVW